MSANINLEYLINCDICFEVYENPQNLKCGHCFCGQCVERLKRKSWIVCPICKQKCRNEQIHPDYKTQALVDAWKTSQEQRTCSEKGEYYCSKKTMCESCFISTNKVTNKCVTCSTLLCTNCNDSHAKTDDHISKPIEIIADEILQNVAMVIETVISSKEKCDEAMRKIQAVASSMSAEAEKMIRDINTREAEVIQEVSRHHDNLRELVNKEMGKQSEKLKQSYRSLKANVLTLENQGALLNRFATVNPDELVECLGAVENTFKEIRQTLDTQDSQLADSAQQKFTAAIVKGELPDLRSVTNVTFPNLTVKSGGVAENDTVRNSKPDKTHFNFNLVRTFKFDGIWEMHFTKDEFYYLDWNSTTINVCNKEFQLLKSVPLKSSDVTGFYRRDSGHYIVATYNGLYMHDSSGNMLQQIKQASFFGVCVYQGNIHAYECAKNQVFIFNDQQYYFEHVQSIYMN